jgi:hypothetical protein
MSEVTLIVMFLLLPTSLPNIFTFTNLIEIFPGIR